MQALSLISKTRTWLLLLLLLPAFQAVSQKNSVKGSIIDTAENKKLHYSIVALINLADTTLYSSSRADAQGKFELTGIPAGKYTLMISYPKMADFLQDITISDTSRVDLGKVIMVTQATLLQEVIVTGGLPIRMRGDTLEYKADSFAVKPGANVLEMFKRLPGFFIDKDGRIEAQGQTVQKILVDGDEFFSDDPGLATKYLRADAIDKVQVFEQKSEKTLFTGIDDGQRTKTINLKLKKDKKNGYFGKLSTGSDGKEYYQHEAMAATFDGPRKAAVYGVSAKTGKTGLSYYEAGQFSDGDYNSAGDRGTYSGLPSVVTGGANYSDKWNDKKEDISANYRLKQNKSIDWSNSTSTIVLPDGTGFHNKNANNSNSSGENHSVYGKFNAALDSFASLRVQVNGGLSQNSQSSNSTGESRNEKDFLVNTSKQSRNNESKSRSFSSDVNYRTRFRKEGRTLSLGFQQNYRAGTSDNYVFSATSYYDPATGTYKNADTLNQLQRSNNPSKSWSAQVSYTDEISKAIRFSVDYGWNNNTSANVFNTYNRGIGKYEERIDSLSNDYDFSTSNHSAGATIAWTWKKMVITTGSRLAFFTLNQTNNDLKANVQRKYTNLAPSLRFNLNISKTSSLHVDYNGSTRQPSIEQLQPLRRSSNQLYVQIGNPDLKPGFDHNASLNFTDNKWAKQRMLRVSLSASYTSNAIVSQTTVDAQNRTVSQYINMDGIPSVNGYLIYNWQLPKTKLRPSISLNASQSGNYMIQNGKKVRNDYFYGSVNTALNYNWEKVMYISYNASVNFNSGSSNITGSKTNRTWGHSHSLYNNVYLPWRVELSSDCNVNFQPKNSAFNSSITYVKWNASITKKLLKNDKGLVRLSVNDILNNNTGYSRSVSGSNIYESNRLVLKRFWMLTLEWSFNGSFNK